MNISVNNISIILIYALPYISFGIGDTSPLLFAYIFFVSTLRLITGDFRPNTYDYLWAGVTIFLSATTLMGGNSEIAIRIFTYGFTIVFTLNLFKNLNLGRAAECFKKIRIFYLIVAAIQAIVGLDAYSSIISPLMNIRYADGRGFTSVGTEPTTFAILYFLFAISNFQIKEALNHPNSKHAFIFDLILAFSITLSSSLVFYITIILILTYLNKRNFISTMLGTLLISAFLFFVILYFPDTRLSSGIIHIYNSRNDLSDFNADSLLILDESIRDRITQPFLSIYLSINNYLVPQDPSDAINAIGNSSSAFSYLVSDEYSRRTFNTGLGELVVMYGIFALYPLSKIWKIKLLSYPTFLAIGVIYFFSIPFGHPTFWSCVTICLICRQLTELQSTTILKKNHIPIKMS